MENVRKNIVKLLPILLLFLLPNIAFTQGQYDGSSDYLFKYGEKLYKQGDIKSAIIELKKSLIVNPNNLDANKLLKKILQEGNIEEPKRDYIQEKNLEIKELNQQIEASRQQLNNVKKDIWDKESLIKELQTSYMVKDAELSGVTKQLANFTIEKETAVKEQQDAIKGLNQELALSKQQLDNANKDIQAKESLIKEIQDKIASVEEVSRDRAAEYNDKLNALQAAAQTKDKESVALKEQLTNLAADQEKILKEQNLALENLNQKINENKEKLDSAERDIQARQSLVKELEDKIISLEQASRDKAAELNTLQAAAQTKDKESAGLKEQLTSLAADKEKTMNEQSIALNNLEQEAKAVKEALENTNKDIRAREIFIKDLKNKIISLEQLAQANKAEIGQLKSEHEALLKSSEAERIAEAAKLKKIMGDLNDKLQKQVNEYESKLELAQKGLVVTVLTDILFNSGSADITNEGKFILNKISKVLKESAADNDIAIEGHTDSQPIKYSDWKSNWELSSARTLSVLHYLIDNCGLNPTRLSANGYGEFSPVAENNGYEGNKANRRVEIIIKPKIIRIKPQQISP